MSIAPEPQIMPAGALCPSSASYDDNLVLLASAEPRHLPFDHVAIGQVFEPAFAEELRAWLAASADWVSADRGFYRQFEFELAHICLAGPVKRLVRREVLAKLLRTCETQFGVPLFSGVSITAHKLVPGQFIGIHTDTPSARHGLETHRLVVQLNEGADTLTGGELQLFAARHAPPACAYAPAHNSGVAFALTAASFHAVAPVRSGERFSLIFTFRAAAGRSDSEVLAGLDQLYRDRLFFAGRPAN